MNWLTDHYIEIFGAVAGIVFVVLEIRQNVLLWPVGIITSAVYIWVFLTSKFYADMALQVYYLVVSFYGWYVWIKGGEKSDLPLPVTLTGRRIGIWLSLISVVLFLAIWYVLKYHTDSPVPVGDAFTTALSVVATWMLARKLLEHWYLWIIVNIVSLALYIYKGLYPTSVLFAVYLVMAFAGLISWKRSMDDLIQKEERL